MDILNVSVDVAKTCFNKTDVFYTKQGEWVNDKTVDVIVAYHAKSLGSEIALSRCECKSEDLDLLVANKCSSEDDAIAMVLNAI
jgi:hypothetical protein